MRYWVILRRSIACLVACHMSVSVLGNLLSTVAVLVFPNMSNMGVSVATIRWDNNDIPPMRHAFTRMLCCYFVNLFVLVLLSALIGIADFDINTYVISAIYYLAHFFICVYILYQCCKKDWQRENAGVS